MSTKVRPAAPGGANIPAVGRGQEAPDVTTETDRRETRSKRDARTADPAVMADALLRNCTLDGVSRFLFWRGTFRLWDRGAYREVADSESKATIVGMLNRTYRHLGRRVVGDVLEQLRAKTLMAAAKEPPAWIGRGNAPRPWAPREVLSTRGGLVHLSSAAAGKTDCTIPPTPRFFTTVALDYSFQPDAPAPRGWLRFMEELWGDDAESVATLQEWMGYLLTPDTKQQKIAMLIGPKRSGKGTIARVLRQLIGPENVAGPTLASLSTNFGLAPLLNKSLGIISDARLSSRTDATTVVERLLSISGEDALTIDRKHREPLTSQLSARLMLLSNELPRLPDTSEAMSSRFLLLHLTESFYGREDPGLSDKLLTELPGILRWAIEGWRRLRERGRFVQPVSGEELATHLAEIGSPLAAFVRERCTVGPGQRETVDALYAAWGHWCRSKGREPGNHQRFGRDLRTAVPGLRDVRPRGQEGGRQRGYEGVALTPPEG